MPSSTGLRSTPSMGRSSGTAPPPRATAVVNRSMAEPMAWTTPGAIVPGHQNTPGTRMPPSKVVPLPFRSGPAEPPWLR